MSTFVVNLLPWRQRRQTRFTRCWWGTLSLLSVCLLLVVMLGNAVVTRQRLAQAAILQTIQTEYQQQRKQLHDVQQARSQWQRYTQQQRANDAMRAQNLRYVQLLEQLAALMPEGLWLTAWVEKEGIISISGMSYGYGDIVQLRARLENDTALSAVQIMHARHESTPSVKGLPPILMAFLLQAAWAESYDATGGLSNE